MGPQNRDQAGDIGGDVLVVRSDACDVAVRFVGADRDTWHNSIQATIESADDCADRAGMLSGSADVRAFVDARDQQIGWQPTPASRDVDRQQATGQGFRATALPTRNRVGARPLPSAQSARAVSNAALLPLC